eukprot:SAG31_NODE_4841_length_2911_cov_19.155761_2_plen_184_part_00
MRSMTDLPRVASERRRRCRWQASEGTMPDAKRTTLARAEAGRRAVSTIRANRRAERRARGGPPGATKEAVDRQRGYRFATRVADPESLLCQLHGDMDSYRKWPQLTMCMFRVPVLSDDFSAIALTTAARNVGLAVDKDFALDAAREFAELHHLSKPRAFKPKTKKLPHFYYERLLLDPGALTP